MDLKTKSFSHMVRAAALGVLFLAAFAVSAPPVMADSYSSSSSSFNSTNIADTSYIWFNSHLTSVTGSFTTPVTIYFTNQTISFTSPKTHVTYSLAVPDAQVTINPAASGASVVFNSSWNTTVKSTSGDPFLSGLTWNVPTGENPKSSTVTWSGNFTATQPVTVSWQWAAAVYSTLSTDNNALGVTPIDSGSIQSGTPTAFESDVLAGAKGGGGSNYTGSNSSTKSANAGLAAAPEPGEWVLIVIGLAMIGIYLYRKGYFAGSGAPLAARTESRAWDLAA